jgi:lipopolysaccharide transport system permease protein
MRNANANRPAHTSLNPVAAPTLVIKPQNRWAPIRPRELWEFRDLLVRFMLRDITLRYRQTALGLSWVLLQPLLAAGVFTFVFGAVADLPSEGVPYFAFTFAAMLGWNLFNSTLLKSSISLTSNTGLVSKIYFPRMVLPLSILGSTLLDFVVAGAMMAAILMIVQIPVTAALVTLPIWILLAVLIGTGVGLASSALMVKYRDVAYVIPYATQILLYATPVAYSLSRVPEAARIWVELNPLTGVMTGLRWSLLGTTTPTTFMTCWSAIAAVSIFLIGATVFSRMERQFADVI